MRTVEDEDGNRYLLVKRSSDATLVRDPETGEQHHVPTDSLDVVTDASPLETAARGIPEPVSLLVTAVHDRRSLGLLLELDDQGSMAVQTLLDRYELCERDLHGLLAEFRAAGLVAETNVHGTAGYETTADAAAALESIRTD